MKAMRILVLMTACSCAAAATSDLEQQCLDCHRPGQTRGEVPMIEGQQRDYLRNQLERFRDRHRLSFPMSALTASMDAASTAATADALAQRAWRADPIPMAADAVTRGAQQAARLQCAGCHGDSFLGAGDIPRVAGQQPGYLARQIGAFGGGHRYHPPTGIGSPMRAVSADQARDLAAFLHALPATADATPEGQDPDDGQKR